MTSEESALSTLTGTTKTTTMSVYEQPLEVLYQDAYMVIVNKPQGMTVMGGRPSLIRCDLLMSFVCTVHEREQLALSLLSTTTKEDRVLGKPRPVHRLDNATGGLLVIAKTYNAETNLRNAFMNRQCHKRYRAVLIGKLDLSVSVQHPSITLLHRSTTTCSKDNDDNSQSEPNTDNESNENNYGAQHVPQEHRPDAVIVADVDGKVSQTLIRIVRYVHAPHDGTDTSYQCATMKQTICTVVDLWPITGRRHQLRKHMKLIGYSIYGDTRYVAPAILAARRQYQQQQQDSLERPLSSTDTDIVCTAEEDDGVQQPSIRVVPQDEKKVPVPLLCLWAVEITLPHPSTGMEMTCSIQNSDSLLETADIYV
jgi:23S rRNA-/tRNA-specific pseudouridylate synthase